LDHGYSVEELFIRKNTDSLKLWKIRFENCIMKKIVPGNAQYEEIINICNEVFDLDNKNFPDDIISDKNCTLICLKMNTRYHKDGLNFHSLLCDFLKLKKQKNYFLVPFFYDMHVVPTIPIVTFSIDDTISAYNNFWDEEIEVMHKVPMRSYIDLPDVIIILNEKKDWFYFEDQALNLSFFGMPSSQQVHVFKSVFNRDVVGDSILDTKEDLENGLKFSSYNDNAKEDFNQWIRPYIKYL
jgi:hypothetical protein